MTQLLSFIAGGSIFRSSFNFFGRLLSESTFLASAPGRLDLESTVPVVAGTRCFHETAIAMNARAFKRYFQRNVQEWTLFSYSPWDWSHCPASSRCRAARISLSPEAAQPPLIHNHHHHHYHSYHHHYHYHHINLAELPAVANSPSQNAWNT